MVAATPATKPETMAVSSELSSCFWGKKLLFSSMMTFLDLFKNNRRFYPPGCLET